MWCRWRLVSLIHPIEIRSTKTKQIHSLYTYVRTRGKMDDDAVKGIRVQGLRSIVFQEAPSHPAGPQLVLDLRVVPQLPRQAGAAGCVWCGIGSVRAGAGIRSGARAEEARSEAATTVLARTILLALFLVYCSVVVVVVLLLEWGGSQDLDSG